MKLMMTIFGLDLRFFIALRSLFEMFERGDFAVRISLTVSTLLTISSLGFLVAATTIFYLKKEDEMKNRPAF